MSNAVVPQRPRRRSLILTAVVLAGLALVYFLTRGRLGGAASAPAGSAAGGGAPAMPPMPVDVDTARRQSIVDLHQRRARGDELAFPKQKPGHAPLLVRTQLDGLHRLDPPRRAYGIDDALSPRGVDVHRHRRHRGRTTTCGAARRRTRRTTKTPSR